MQDLYTLMTKYISADNNYINILLLYFFSLFMSFYVFFLHFSRSFSFFHILSIFVSLFFFSILVYFIFFLCLHLTFPRVLPSILLLTTASSGIVTHTTTFILTPITSIFPSILSPFLPLTHYFICPEFLFGLEVSLPQRSRENTSP